MDHVGAHQARDCLVNPPYLQNMLPFYAVLPGVGLVLLGAPLEIFFYDSLHRVNGLFPEDVTDYLPRGCNIRSCCHILVVGIVVFMVGRVGALVLFCFFGGGVTR